MDNLNVGRKDYASSPDESPKRLFIETYGCQMNFADSEVVASVMQMAGYELCQDLKEADAVFMNTCSIREHAESKALSRLEYFQSLKKRYARA